MYTRFMARMVRKQVYIEPAQEKALKRSARSLGVPEADLVRRALAGLGGLRRPAAAPPDMAAWQDALRFMRARTAGPGSARQRDWTRDDLYAERLERRGRRAR